MAKAYACDRCGELFKLCEHSVTIPVILESNKKYDMDLGDTQTYISLCPKCRAEFQKWWDEGAAHKTTEPVHQDVTTLYEVTNE